MKKNVEEKMCAAFNDNIAKKIKVMCPEGKGSEEIYSEGKHALQINLWRNHVGLWMFR